MRILCPIVEPLMRAVFDVRHDLALGGSIRAELVSDHPSRRAALDDLIKDVSVLVNSPPQSVFLASNGNHDLVEVPDVAAAWGVAPESAGVCGPEL
jgi:hypothetical protein